MKISFFLFFLHLLCLFRAYQACYPLGVSSYISDVEDEVEGRRRGEEVFEDLEEERMASLLSALRNSVFKQVNIKLFSEAGCVSTEEQARTSCGAGKLVFVFMGILKKKLLSLFINFKV